MSLCDTTGRFRVGVAFREALLNALFHGSLEMGAQLKELDDVTEASEERDEAIRRRCREVPFCDRRIHVFVRVDSEHAEIVIRDEGPGFDTTIMPASGNPASLGPGAGRGSCARRGFCRLE